MARWQGIIAVEGEPTGDGRMLELKSLRWDVELLPMPLVWDRDAGSHEAAVVGTVTEIWREDNYVMAAGDLSESNDPETQAAVQRVVELLEEGAVGVSVRLDDESVEIRVSKDVLEEEEQIIEAIEEDGELPQGEEVDGRIVMGRFRADDALEVTTDARIRHVAIVDTPAIADARIQLEGGDNPTVPEDEADEEERERLIREAVANVDPEQLADEEAELQFPCPKPFPSHADCVDRMSQEDIDDPDAFCAAWERECEGGATASIGHNHPEARIALVSSVDTDAFSDPQFGSDPDDDPRLVRQEPERPGETVAYGCPLTVTDDGRVFGHAALWGRCHAGFSGRCVTPPRGGGYGRFLSGEAIPGVRTGPLTIGTTHPDLRASAADAMDHYADTGSAVADVTVGEDRHGIWVSGRLRPSIGEDDVVELRGSSLSGDWRPIGGQLRLIGLLAVNNPGFLVERGEPTSEHALAAAITVGPCCGDTALTAQAEHSGAAIMAVPITSDAERLAVDGHQDAAELHVTLAFLGEADAIDDERREEIRQQVGEQVDGMSAFTAAAFGYGMMNPNGEAGDPAAVLFLQDEALSSAREAFEQLDVGNHPSWIPHMTMSLQPNSLELSELEDRVGDISFDRLRLVFGEEVDEYPLPGADDMATRTSENQELRSMREELEAMRARQRALEVIAGDYLTRDIDHPRA